MGKKRIIQKTEEAVVASEKSAVKTDGRKVEGGKIYINASYNNTVITATDNRGNVLAWASAGSLGFSGPKKATPFAASKVAEVIYEKLRRSGPVNVEILVKGVGSGRDSAIRSLVNRGFNPVAIRDLTPIPHNGPRPKKVRRV